MKNPLIPFLAWLQRKRASRALREAERKRNAIMAQIAHRTSKHRERAYLHSDLRQATEASLRASVGQEWAR